jgi:hypothetical protein
MVDAVPFVSSGKVRVPEGKFYEDDELVNQNGIPVVLPNPTRDERREIKFYKTIYKGVMFITGGARQGKDLTGVVISYLMKRYFGRPILLDFKPMRLFGDYTYFNPQLMMAEISRMARLSAVMDSDMKKPLSEAEIKVFEEASVDWVNANPIFQNAVVYFSELGRYCPKRAPMNRVNRFIGALCSQWGHLDMLVLGTHLQQSEIDRFTFLDKAKLWAVCSWMRTRADTTRAEIARDMRVVGDQVFHGGMRNVNYFVDGGQPREYLTTEETVFAITLQGRKRASENAILGYLRGAGPTRASEIADSLGVGIDDALEALYSLSLMGLVTGNNFFSLYKSKNLVNLVPALRKEA